MGAPGLVLRQAQLKYHYSHRRYTYSVRRKSARRRARLLDLKRRRARRSVLASGAGTGAPRSVASSRGGGGGSARARSTRRFPGGARRDPLRRPCQAGSLTGAVHLSKGNAGVLR